MADLNPRSCFTPRLHGVRPPGGDGGASGRTIGACPGTARPRERAPDRARTPHRWRRRGPAGALRDLRSGTRRRRPHLAGRRRPAGCAVLVAPRRDAPAPRHPGPSLEGRRGARHRCRGRPLADRRTWAVTRLGEGRPARHPRAIHRASRVAARVPHRRPPSGSGPGRAGTAPRRPVRPMRTVAHWTAQPAGKTGTGCRPSHRTRGDCSWDWPSGEQAVVFAVDPTALQSGASLNDVVVAAWALPLGGRGVRDLASSPSGSLLVLAGGASAAEMPGTALYAWTPGTAPALLGTLPGAGSPAEALVSDGANAAWVFLDEGRRLGAGLVRTPCGREGAFSCVHRRTDWAHALRVRWAD